MRLVSENYTSIHRYIYTSIHTCIHTYRCIYNYIHIYLEVELSFSLSLYIYNISHTYMYTLHVHILLQYQWDFMSTWDAHGGILWRYTHLRHEFVEYPAIPFRPAESNTAWNAVEEAILLEEVQFLSKRRSILQKNISFLVQKCSIHSKNECSFDCDMAFRSRSTAFLGEQAWL